MENPNFDFANKSVSDAVDSLARMSNVEKALKVWRRLDQVTAVAVTRSDPPAVFRAGEATLRWVNERS